MARYRYLVGITLIFLCTHQARPEVESSLFDLIKNAPPGTIERAITERDDLHARDARGATPLIRAVQFRQEPEIIQVLIAAGSDVNARADNGVTTLMVAAAYNTPEIIRMLISAGAKVEARIPKDNHPVLLSAAENNPDPDVIDALVEAGADVHARDKYGTTALMRAAQSNDAAVVRALIEAGADVHAESDEGSSPLMIAVAYENDRDVIESLLKAGADPDAGLDDGTTPLMLAAKRGNEDAIKALLDGGARAERTNEKGKTALDYAISEEHLAGTDVLNRLKRLSENRPQNGR